IGAVPHLGSLPAQQSYHVEHTFTLPIDAAGQYVIVKTGVPEDPFKGNDARAKASAVTNAPSDLHITDIKTPSQSFSGEPAHIEWTVENLGAPVWTGTSYWQDDVYISPDATFIAERATKLGSFAQPNVPQLAHNATYTQKQDVRLPKGIDGQFCIYI